MSERSANVARRHGDVPAAPTAQSPHEQSPHEQNPHEQNPHEQNERQSRSWSIGSRITALTVGVGVALSMIAATAALTATTTRDDVSRLVERISPAAVNAERLMSVTLAQQAGVLQYAASGHNQFLDQYDRAVADEDVLYGTTKRLLADEPSLLRQLRAIRSELAGWRDEVAEPLISTVAAAGPDARRATLSRAGQDRFDAIVASISEFQRAVSAARDRLRKEVRESSNILVALLFSAAVVVLAAGGLLLLVLSRLVTRPVVALASQVRRVADGDYEYEISGVGPPEVERLAWDVNAMRKRIASDLREVRAARRQVEEVNQRLEAQAEELTRSNRDLEQFAYVASHDLQEPLRKVASFCQLLQRRYSGQLDERADQYIYYAVDGAQRMQRLINDLLAFSRIGRMATGFTEVALNKVIDDIVGQREPVGGAITRDDLPTVRGEEPLLSALLNNLIGNSVKFRRPGTPARVHVGATREGGEWHLYVRDNGIGIDPEFVDKVFVLFQRLHAKEAYPGTGIGLAIAKKIVEYHGGRIWVDTEYRDGTLIRFILPAIVTADDETAATPVVETVETAAGSTVAEPPVTGPAAADPLPPVSDLRLVESPASESPPSEPRVEEPAP